MSIEFQVNDIPYKSTKIPGMTQLYMIKKAAPALSYAVALFGKKELEASDLQTMMHALAVLADDDATYIVDQCLRLCERANGNGGWAKIWNSQIRQPMFDDIGASEIMKIVGEVVRGSFGNFSQGTG
jgi:hypothetical protein